MGSDGQQWECLHLPAEGTGNTLSSSQLKFLLQVAAPIVSDKTCQERVCNVDLGLFKIQNCIIADNHICAGGLGGKGPCKVKAGLGCQFVSLKLNIAGRLRRGTAGPGQRPGWLVCRGPGLLPAGQALRDRPVRRLH